MKDEMNRIKEMISEKIASIKNKNQNISQRFQRSDIKEMENKIKQLFYFSN
jgi:hydrogenase maturation factor HypE